MPRPERPVDPAGGVIQQFAFELRKLRENAGNPTYRQLAAASGYSIATLSHAAGGRRLPSLDVTLAYARACGGDPDDWSARWHATAVAAARQRPTQAGTAPYRGLDPHGEDDAGLFFGRDQLVADVLARCAERRLVVLLGVSGAGKSSLLAAGVLPALRERSRNARGETRTALVTPDGGPWGVVCAALGADGGGSADAVARRLDELAPETELVLVVDQFERLFTRYAEEERAAFLDGLLALAGRVDRRCTVVCSVRTGFAGRCAEHAEFTEAVSEAVEVGPMSPDELRAAVARPAASVGLSVERALLATAVTDVAGRPGALPLLSEALRDTWRQRRGEVLTLAGYQAAGGVRGVACALAEAAMDRLPRTRHELAADLLLRLVTVDAETAAPRNGVEHAELLDVDRDAGEVLAELTDARVITEGATVELTHVALIEDWPRLRDRLSADRADLVIRQELTEAARTWLSLGRDPSALYRGTRLIATTGWLHHYGRRIPLAGSEREFLDASLAAQTRELAVQRRRSTQLRRLSVALAVLVVIALTATVLAVVQAHQVNQANELIRSRQLAAEARMLAATDVVGALRKALDAYRAAPTDEARSVVLSFAGTQAFHGRLTGHTGRVNALAITADGRTMVSGSSDRTAIVWDVGDRRARHVLDNSRQVRDVAISPDGATVAVSGRDGTLSLWRLADGTRVTRLAGHEGSVEAVAYDRTGDRLVSLGSKGTAIVWDTATHAARGSFHTRGGMNSDVAVHPRDGTVAVATDNGTLTRYDPASGAAVERLDTGTRQPLYAVAFHSTDGSLVAAGKPETLFFWNARRKLRRVQTGTDGTVHDLGLSDGGTLYCGCGRQTLAWNAADRAREAVLGGPTGAVYAVAASADGSVSASAGTDGSVLLWSRPRLPLLWHTDGVRGLATSPDGRTLVSGSADGTVARWRTADRALQSVHTGHTAQVNAVDVSPDGRSIASASNDHTVASWTTHAREPVTLAHPDQVRTVAFSPDGEWLYSGCVDGRVRRWHTRGPSTPTVLYQHDRPVYTLALSQDGRFLASAGLDGRILLTDFDRSRRITLTGHKGRIDALTFSPDGEHLLAGGAQGDILAWRTGAGAGQRPARLVGHSQPVTTLAFSPDGRFLASGGNESTVIVWDFASRSRWTTLSGHTDKVVSTAWSPDGKTLYTGGADQLIIPWLIDPAAAVAKIRGQLATDFPR